MSGAALLDVNVLMALFDPNHVHHDIAHDWFAEIGDTGWASCPLTENGFLRTAKVARTATYVPIPELIDGLRAFQASSDHEFWPADVSLLDGELFNSPSIHGTKQLTDIYLLALAVRHDGRLVTFDSRISLAAVKGSRPEHLVVLAPAE
jgi:uncharacterized protein